jgi:26S proteasome regulatory subunit N2
MMMATTMTTTPVAPSSNAVATASGWIALLQEQDTALKAHALKKLLGCVDNLWHEVAESLPDLETIAEDLDLPLQMRQTAAAVASRVFFHLDESSQALRLALEAGEQHFDIQNRTPYVESLIAAALDAYIQERRKFLQQQEENTNRVRSAGNEIGISLDQLQGMVYRLLDTCCEEGRCDHALGIALEAQETSKLKDILMSSGPDEALLKYALEASISVVSSKTFRQEALAVIAECLSSQTEERKMASVDTLIIVYQLLGKADSVSEVLESLLKGSEKDALLGFQLCFDLVDSGDQAFVTKVAEFLKPLASQEHADRWSQVSRVLTGGFSSELSLSFLHKQSQADRLIMENLKKSLEERGSGGRSSLLHNAAVMTHAYLYAGTTNDSFLRDYLDWMKKASNWAKFSATASLGVIHAGHVTEAMQLLQPYLPANPSSGEGGGGSVVSTEGGYAEGGSLYALGLIHGSHSGSSAEKRKETSEFIRTHLRASHANEVISHGAALGVGLTSMGFADFVIVNELKELLDTDSAVAGEAAGMAIGMVLVGTGAGNAHNSLPSEGKEEIMEIVSELKNYARETQHEKIIRGISIGLALMQYQQEENADAMIEDMRTDRDPVLRYGAQYALALAYCGTGSNKAIRILLHTAVSDVSDDVRMAAVISLSFVLFKTPERVPQLVKLLMESFNPHVRYASCIAVGIAMAGTGDSESITMLEPMLDDMTDYVRQGALIGTAMIYMQQSDTCNNRKVKSFREKLSSLVGEKHQSTLTKMGAILSLGIIDAAGRNCSISLGSRNGFTRMTSAVGLILWLQHWHWYPMMHTFSLALTPTYTIGLNKNFKFPKTFKVVCNSKPSTFAYPKKLEEKKEEKKKRVETVTLSITAKEKARQARKRAKEENTSSSGSMEVENHEDNQDLKMGEGKANTEDGDQMNAEKQESPEKKSKKKREPEATSFRISNPSRVTSAQAQECEFDLTQRYRPIRVEEKPFGVIILIDSTPGEAEDLGAVKAPSLEPDGECAPPEPFEWTPPEEISKEES